MRYNEKNAICEDDMNKKVTIYDIAREAGVSTATVTRVVSGSEKVRPETRERVQRVIDAYAYAPSAAARNLDGGDLKTIALIIPNLYNPYFGRIYDSAYAECRENGFSLFPYQVTENTPIPAELVDEMIRRRFDGALFAGNLWSSERSGLVHALSRLRHHMPVVAICPPSAKLDCICVHSDLLASSRLPVQHLHALGHKKIAFVGSSSSIKDASKRGEYFLEELKRLGLDDDPAFHVDSGNDVEGGRRAVLRILSSLEKSRWPTALVCFNDLVAMGALSQLQEMGLRLPDDMAVIGFDNQFFCPYLNPPLTSVDTHPEKLARSAIRELLSAKGDTSIKFSIAEPATLVIRRSCGSELGYRRFT